jgi:hypothetical protein
MFNAMEISYQSFALRLGSSRPASSRKTNDVLAAMPDRFATLVHVVAAVPR